MGKKRSLTVDKRAKIVALHEVGFSEREISVKVNVSKTAVHQAICKFQTTGKYTDLKRSGRPRKTTTRDKKDGNAISHNLLQENKICAGCKGYQRQFEYYFTTFD